MSGGLVGYAQSYKLAFRGVYKHVVGLATRGALAGL